MWQRDGYREVEMIDLGEPVRHYDENGEPQDEIVLATEDGPVWVAADQMEWRATYQ